MERYNGWSNRATWNANLWLVNDEGLYSAAQEAVSDALRRATDQDTAQEELAIALESLYDAMVPDDLPGPIQDLLTLDQVDWSEIAESLLSEEEEYIALGAEEPEEAAQ